MQVALFLAGEIPQVKGSVVPLAMFFNPSLSELICPQLPSGKSGDFFFSWRLVYGIIGGRSGQVWAQLAADSPGVDSTFGLLSSSSDFSRPFLLLQAWGWDDRAINKLDFDFTFLERTLNIWSFSDHKKCDWELCGWLNPRSQLEYMEASSRQGESLQRSMSWPGWGNKVRNGLHVALWASGFLGQKRSIDCGDRFGPLDTDRVHSWSLEEPKYCKLVHSYGKICWNTTFEQLAGNVFRSKPSSFNDLFMNHFDPHLVSSFSSFSTFITFSSFTTLITFTTFSMFSTRLPCHRFFLFDTKINGYHSALSFHCQRLDL